MIHKTKFWVILFSAVAVIGAAAFFLLRSMGAAEGVVARVWLHGEIIEEIELDTEVGTNRVRVEHGSILVVSADCPDQVCVRQGAITGGYVPIACVPH